MKKKVKYVKSLVIASLVMSFLFAAFGIYQLINNKYLPLIEQIACFLKYHGIFLAGIDMIGQYITEINITSPTGIQQIGKGLSTKIANQLLKNIDNYHQN